MECRVKKTKETSAVVTSSMMKRHSFVNVGYYIQLYSPKW